MRNIVVSISLLWLSVCAHSIPSGDVDWMRLNIAAREQAKTPIRAGVPGMRPFWNRHSKAFICVNRV